MDRSIEFQAILLERAKLKKEAYQALFNQLGPEHLETILMLKELASLYYIIGYLKEAKEYARTVYNYRNKCTLFVSVNFPLEASILYSKCLLASKEYDEILKILPEVYVKEQDNLDAEPMDLYVLADILKDTYIAKNNLNKALEHYEAIIDYAYDIYDTANDYLDIVLTAAEYAVNNNEAKFAERILIEYLGTLEEIELADEEVRDNTLYSMDVVDIALKTIKEGLPFDSVEILDKAIKK